jgi:hypothetical protein
MEYANIHTVLANYNAAKHPRVLTGETTAKLCRELFAAALHIAGKHTDGRIYKDEFVQHYLDISASEPVGG